MRQRAMMGKKAVGPDRETAHDTVLGGGAEDLDG
jgi:hypothetical protein